MRLMAVDDARGVMTEIRKPDLCPEGGSTLMKRIVGGHPGEKGMKMIEAGEGLKPSLSSTYSVVPVLPSTLISSY